MTGQRFEGARYPVSVNVRVSREVARALERIAKRRGWTPAQVKRAAIEFYVERAGETTGAGSAKE